MPKLLVPSNFSASNIALVIVVLADEDEEDASAILLNSNGQFLQQLFTLENNFYDVNFAGINAPGKFLGEWKSYNIPT